MFMALCSLEQRYSGNDIINMVKILHSNNYFDDPNNYLEYKLKRHFEGVLEEISKPDFNKDIFFGNLYEQMGFYKHAFNLTVYYLSIIDKETKIGLIPLRTLKFIFTPPQNLKKIKILMLAKNNNQSVRSQSNLNNYS